MCLKTKSEETIFLKNTQKAGERLPSNKDLYGFFNLMCEHTLKLCKTKLSERLHIHVTWKLEVIVEFNSTLSGEGEREREREEQINHCLR